MARIAGLDLPKDKRIEIGLTYIYGIGRKSAQDLLAQTGINPDTRVKDLTEADEAKLREAKSNRRVFRRFQKILCRLFDHHSLYRRRIHRIF